MNSDCGDLGVRQPVGDSGQHLALALGQRVQPWVRLGRADRRLLHELLDQPPGDLRRQQRLAVRDDPHRSEQIVGQRVLEQEPAGARPAAPRTRTRRDRTW